MNKPVIMIETATKSNFNLIKFDFVGSKVTCDPPPKDTDTDILVLVDDLARALGFMHSQGWKTVNYIIDPEGSDENRFASVKDPTGETNLIITQSEVFYNKFMTASKIAKTLNLLNKADRVKLFQYILYGVIIES